MSEGRFAGLYDLSFGIFLKKIQHDIAKIANRYKCKKIVDLGCGTGSQCNLFDSNFKVIGMDISPQMLAVAKRKNNSITCICGDIINTCFPNKLFDCSILSFVLHMNNPDDQQKILHEAMRITKDDGIMVITDYGVPYSTKGKIADLLVKIIENLAVEEHRKNYYEYVERGSLDAIIKNQNFFILEKRQFYFGTVETIVIKKRG